MLMLMQEISTLNTAIQIITIDIQCFRSMEVKDVAFASMQ